MSSRSRSYLTEGTSGGVAGNGARAAALDASLERLPLERTLPTVVSSFGPGKLAVISAFGPGSLVVLHALHELGIRLPVLFVDTLHHFPETLQHVERVRDLYNLDLRIFRPYNSISEFEANHGPKLWERDLDGYQQISKVEPFRRATQNLDAWFTGRRREQSDTRAQLQVVEGTDQLKINPLANWTKSDVWRYILSNSIPYNPLHDQGYASIGDRPLTTPVAAGEPERAGRWRGVERTECGIHLG
ncbi:MAG: phosphoadenylyl-sulfate reductase [Gemmatimonas sp.]|nr:phosphoadenylyl-sulfate reductase [Gemmatimonas sp.]